jgi:hypothetical protein
VSPGTNVVTGKWLFHHKLTSDDSLDRYKAHWILRDFTQCPGVDYDETFSPVVKFATVRVVISLALSRVGRSIRSTSRVPSSTGGHKYYIIFIDDHSRYTWIYFMKRYSELVSIYKSFARMIHT